GSVDWRKCDVAAELAAVFAFSAVQNADRIGLLLFGGGATTFIAPRRGRAHAQVIVRAAVDAAMKGPRGRADVDHAVTVLERGARPAARAALPRQRCRLDRDLHRGAIRPRSSAFLQRAKTSKMIGAIFFTLFTATFRPAAPTVGDPIAIDFPAPVVLDKAPDYE